MKITHLSINNYKSLRSIHIAPRELNVIVGANASGKSNLADCLDFISEIYRHGLEVAVARKGGYENIAFRRQRRSKSAVAIDLSVELSGDELRAHYWAGPRGSKPPAMRVRHRFSFAARGYSIRAEFKILSEELTFALERDNGWEDVATISRSPDGALTLVLSEQAKAARGETRHVVRDHRYGDFLELSYFFERNLVANPTDLVSTTLGRFTVGMSAFVNSVGNIRVFQISPAKSREFGVPTPRPELAGNGANLPAVVDLLQKKSPKEWKEVLHAMRSIMPGLHAISVDYTSSRTLGLFFEEEGSGRPWSVSEVSDGTIQTLGLLVAIFDPQSTALMLEEPENSVHPWIIRHILNACREASRAKQIVLTTHSPIVMNAVRPDELFVMWRSEGESRLSSFVALDPQFSELWTSGDIPTFEYLDSGAMREAIPPGPSIEEA